MKLRRYTNIPSLIYLLQNKAITLLSPATWDDTNDSHSLDVYKKKLKLQTVLALCFTETSETYHHWHVFAGGNGGACIVFNRGRLLNALDEYEGIKHQSVEYRTLRQMNDGGATVDELPFVKRAGFSDECEFRVVYESATEKRSSIDMPIPLSAIDSIYLNPWLGRPLVEATKIALNSIADCDGINILRSTLVGSRVWKDAVSDAANKMAD
ncbi:hypothetical protein PI87_16465 [Ralstonia sp. A12]|uniref:DUF2971 domain-containing protein n=1 Tax=Ralstonia sp. A12 TaxID=1217052 RepID=UPI00057487C3|nr:DUF2971 domain-containing protein [Ralstonia sp. A12]KHK54110.1 hypothetical protein PI87_16465 [Ralstonia sp. A12]